MTTYYTPPQAALYLGLSRTRVEQLIADGKLKLASNRVPGSRVRLIEARTLAAFKSRVRPATIKKGGNSA